jgi:hypothetical protein
MVTTTLLVFVVHYTKIFPPPFKPIEGGAIKLNERTIWRRS